MKTTPLYKIIPSFALLLFCAHSLFAQSIEKQKNISRTFSASNVGSLKIDNQFGKVVVKQNTSNEVKVEISIIGRANTEPIAQQLVDDVSIKETGVPDISFSSKLEREKGYNKSGGKSRFQHFEINYTISVPSNLSLNIANQFGPIEMVDHSGSLKVDSKFGSFSAGLLGNVSKINVEFGKINCKSVGGKSPDIQIKFSNGSIGELNGDALLKLDYSKITAFAAGSNLTGIDVKSNYGNVNFNIGEMKDASFNIKTHFGNFTNNTGYSIVSSSKEDDENSIPKFDEEYSGKIGSGAIKVSLTSNFGNVKLGKK